MSLKSFLFEKLSLFFMLTTLITVAISVIGHVFDANARFGYDSLLTPLVYAGCCVVPTLVTYSRRELSVREMMVRIVLEWLLIEAVMLGFAFTSPVIDTSRVSVVLAIAGSVLLIYVLARLFSWLRDYGQARKINQELLRFQQLHE
jgi:hypothetical protein